jgi:hypothetical protein
MQWAGSLALFPSRVGSSFAQSLDLSSFQPKRLIFGSLETPSDIHVYGAFCQAGERLRVQMLTPVLPSGRGLAPAVALVAQSLPYSADTHRLPVALPAGFSAVVAPPLSELRDLAKDPLTAARTYPGPAIDTRTLVSGRCYIVVWSPQHQRGKYALQVGTMWPWSWLYWVQLPRIWWQIRGWFGLSRAAVWIGGAILALLGVSWALRRQWRNGKR